MKPALTLSVLLNIVFLGIILWPQSKQEKEIIEKFREVQSDFNKKILVEEMDTIFQKSEEIMNKISDKWELKTAKEMFTSEVLKTTGDDKLAQMLNIFKKLGKFKQVVGNKRVSNYPTSPNSKVVFMFCEFEHGKGNVNLVLKPSDKGWLIEGLNINSDLFLQAYSKQNL